eukprot:GILK01014017.1.p1 GENE.GILK01014017.1~~GILK01014017.1.p1  ORF type:complete len:229 (-),score=23.30 GILK01014017.1:68-754(-)
MMNKVSVQVSVAIILCALCVVAFAEPPKPTLPPSYYYDYTDADGNLVGRHFVDTVGGRGAFYAVNSASRLLLNTQSLERNTPSSAPGPAPVCAVPSNALGWMTNNGVTYFHFSNHKGKIVCQRAVCSAIPSLPLMPDMTFVGQKMVKVGGDMIECNSWEYQMQTDSTLTMNFRVDDNSPVNVIWTDSASGVNMVSNIDVFLPVASFPDHLFTPPASWKCAESDLQVHI